MSISSAISPLGQGQTQAAVRLGDRPSRQVAPDVVPVLPTKLRPRTPNRVWVERTALISKLEGGAGKRLTLISAPAGFGKSCLVSQWIHLSKRKFAWFSLDEHDDCLDVFVRCVVAALRTQVPGFASEIDAYLRGIQIPPPEFLADILTRFADFLDEPIWLVLDDYHAINSPAVHSFLSRLVENLPATLRLVVLSRRNLPRLRKRYFVQNWINEFRADDLCFSLEETYSFFQRAGCEIDRETVAALHAESEGWIAGLQLVQLSALTGGSILPERMRAAAHEEGRLFHDLLVQEVISRQSPEIQQFMAVTSLFDRFCAPLCDAVLSHQVKPGYSSQIINRLRDSNLFVVPIDSEGIWFRYHHLFSKAVKSLPHLRPGPNQLLRMRRKAARWFAEQNLVPEALQLFIAAGDIDTAVAFFEEHLHAIIREDFARRNLKRFLDMFPPGAEGKYPALLVARAFCFMVRMGTKQMTPILDRADKLLRGSQKVSERRKRFLQTDIDAMHSFCCFWEGNTKGAITLASRVLRSAPKERHYSRGMAAMYVALGLCASGRDDLALRFISKELAEDCEEGFHRIGMLMTVRLAVYYWRGDLDLLSESGIEMEEAAKSVPIPSLFAAYGTYFQARVALERSELEAATGYFSQLKAMQYQILPRVYESSLVALAMTAVGRGDPKTARKYATLARKWALEIGDPDQVLVADCLDARLAMQMGRTPAVLHGNSAMKEWTQPWLVQPYLTRLECAVHTSSPKQCAKILPAIEKALRRARHFHFVPQIIPALTVKAMALWRAGRPKAGLEVLRQSLLMGEPRGFVRTFVDRSPLIRELLQALLEKNPNDEYVKKLLAVHSGSSDRGGPAADRSGSTVPSESGAELTNGLEWERLSNREVDVLGMLSERLSNKEIAQRLFVTPETTKKHAANIYQKLRVHGRREAVEVARKLQLLPSLMLLFTISETMSFLEDWLSQLWI